MALAILRLDDSDENTHTLTVDTGTSTHFRIHLGKEVRRDEGFMLLDGPYWSSPLQVNQKAGRHVDTRTTYRLPAGVVTARGSLAQLESCRGPDGRGKAFSRPVRLPGYVAVGYRAARSNHTGGVNVLLADGSVRFVRDSVDPVMWRGVGTRAGGEVVSGDF